jgi:E3 ubiquitin-protein ligase HUWE1
MNGFSRFNIHKDYGGSGAASTTGAGRRLPSAHTCFNQLDLPVYDNYEVLREQLLVAINQGTGHFGFV